MANVQRSEKGRGRNALELQIGVEMALLWENKDPSWLLGWAGYLRVPDRLALCSGPFQNVSEMSRNGAGQGVPVLASAWALSPFQPKPSQDFRIPWY